MLAAPILKRDLTTFLRSRWAFVLIFFALILIAGVVAQSWTGVRSAWMSAALEEQPARLTSQGRTLFRSLLRGQLFILSALAPLVAASAIAAERERDTLFLLLSSPIRMTKVIWEKFVSSIAFVLLVLLATVPTLSLSLLAGGIDPQEIVMAELLSVCTALGYGMLGLFCSTFRPKVYETYLLTVIVVFLVAVVIPFGPSVWHYVLTLEWKSPPIYNFGLHDLSPLVALDRIVVPEGGARALARYANNPSLGLTYFAILWSVLIVVLFFFSRRRLGILATGAKTFVQTLLDGSNGEKTQEIPDNDDVDDTPYREWSEGQAVLGLERHRQWFGRMSVLLRLLYLALLVSVITLPLASYRGSWLFFTLPFLAAALFTVPLAATTLGSERDSLTLDILRTTLVTDRSIVQAKFMVALQLSLILALALYLPGLLTLLVYGIVLGHELDLLLEMRDVVPLISHPILLVFSLALYNALGLHFSSRFHSTNVALLTTTLFVLGLLLLPLPALHMLGTWISGAMPSGLRWLLLGGIGLPLTLINPFAILVLLSTEGNIELLGLHVNNVLATFQPFGPLFIIIYGVLVTLISWRLVRAAEANL